MEMQVENRLTDVSRADRLHSRRHLQFWSFQINRAMNDQINAGCPASTPLSPASKSARIAHSARICRNWTAKPAKRGCSGNVSAVKPNPGFLINATLALIFFSPQ
jgi:hypothetical protein